MYLNGDMLLGTNIPFWIAQLSDPGVDTAEEAAFIFSGPQFFVALVSGVLLAFGFQLLLTNLSVASGVTYLGARSGSSHSSSSSSSQSSSGFDLGGTVRKISLAAGIWTLITVSLALFFACWLAVKLSLADSPFIGVVLGLVIWAAYFSLLVWFSSTAVGSMVGSVVKTATSSFQALFNTATAALGAKAANHEIVKTVEASASAIRREIAGSIDHIDPEGLREKLEDYLHSLRSPQIDADTLQQEFERTLRESNLLSQADPESLQNVDRQVFIDLVSSRTDLSRQETNRIAAQLERTWKQAVGESNRPDRLGELVDYFKSAEPKRLVSEELGSRLDALIEELRARRKVQQQQGTSALSQGVSNAFNALMGIAMGRADLSDLDVEKVTNQLKSAQHQLSDQAGKISSKVSSQGSPRAHGVIQADVENYLLSTYSWQLTPQRIRQEFREVLYDPNGDPGDIRRQIEHLSRADFVELLQSRGLFTQEEIRRRADTLEQVRIEALRDVKAVEVIEKSKALRRRVETYLQLRPKPILESDSLEGDLRTILQDPEADTEDLHTRFAQFDRTTLVSILTSRPDITAEEAHTIAERIEKTMNLVLADSSGMQEAAKARVQQQWGKIANYLRNTGKSELSPEGLERDLTHLLDDPQASIHDVRLRLAQFDRDTLVQLLSQRQDLSEADANRILDQVEGNWHRVRYAPQHLASTVSEQYDKATTAIADYLRNTGKDELNPEGIRRDLQLLMDDPRAGASALRDRLARMDRDTFVQLLSQRQDMSEGEVNQVIDQIQGTLQDVVRAPRRLATRTQNQIQDFQTALTDYLRNTEKEELHPAGIQRDLKLLLEDPRLGARNLRDRLSQFDRSTMVALLSQRQDISEAEANQIVDRILSVREQFVEQVRAVQYQVQALIDRILDQVRGYLNSLDRPELNYEGVKHDIRLLFDNPEVGAEAMRQRLSQFDRNTLVAILSSNDRISEADVNHIIDRIEHTRDSVVRRAERLQAEVQRRLEAVQHETEKQMEELQQAAIAASWWLFATALISGILAAVGGSLAVLG